MKRCVCVLAGLALAAAWQALPPGAAAGGAAKGWGSLKGHVVYNGPEAPQPKKLAVTKDEKHCLAHGDLYDETWVVNKKNKGVRYVFLWLEDPSGNELPVHPKLKDVPEKAAVMDQPTCQFVPHALAIREGQALVAKNSMDIPHNFHWLGIANPGGNRLMPPKSQFTIKKLRADKFPVHIMCDIHPWMSGWVGVFDHPYYALTDADGKFEIKLAPAGTYKLKVWMGGYGWMGGVKGRAGMNIAIRPGETTELGRLKIGPAKR
jgi:hypothetical protein